MKRIFSILITVLILMIFSVPVFADNTTITDTKEYTSTDKNKTMIFPETKNTDDKTYDLVDVKYEVINSEQEATKKTVTQTQTYSGLVLQEVPELIKSDDYPDITLSLKDVEYNTQELDSTMAVTGTTDYGYLTYTPAAAQSKQVEYTSNIGNTLNAALPLVSVTQADEPAWRSGFVIYSSYYGEPDSVYFEFDGTRIPNTADGSVPYKGYESAILEYLGLNSTVYRIDSAVWTGSGEINGVTVRTAEFSCSSLAARYVATYSAEVPNQGYTAEATYSADAELPTGKRIYTIQATAEYELAEEPVNLVIPISIAIVVLILVVLAILFLFKHRKKQGNNV